MKGEKMANCKDLLISIVNGNTSGLIKKCVESIFEHTDGISFDVIVIDNCTGYEGLGELERMGARILVNSEKYGFSKNHSQALPFLDGYRYICVFNDDAYLLNNALKILICELDQDRTSVIAGPHIEDPDGSLQPSAARFFDIRYFIQSALGIDRPKGQRYSSYLQDYIEYEKNQYVDWLSGCCMVIRKEFIDKYGFLDTGFFMFLEDTELCLRARRAGYKTKYMADARIAHYGALSSKGESGRFKPWLYIERQRSRLYYLRRYSLPQYMVYVGFINIYLIVKMLLGGMKGRFDESLNLAKEMRYRFLV